MYDVVYDWTDKDQTITRGITENYSTRTHAEQAYDNLRKIDNVSNIQIIDKWDELEEGFGTDELEARIYDLYL